MTIRLRFLIVFETIAILFFARPVRAQTTAGGKFSFTAGGEVGLVTAFEQTYHDFDIAGTIMAQYRLSKNLAFTFTTGYTDFLSKTYQKEDVELFGGYYGTASGNLGLIPLKAGVRVFTDQHFYLSAEGGSWIYTGGYDYYNRVPAQNYNEPVPGEIQVLLSAGLGWFLNKTDIGFRYDAYSVKADGYNSGVMHYGTVTFHLAYILK